VVKTIDQDVRQHRVGVGAIEELEQLVSKSRLPFPPVGTSEDVDEVLDWKFIGGTCTGVRGRVIVMDLFSNWKLSVPKNYNEGMAFVLKGVDGPSVAVPIDI
jgi:hypothetical protein